MCVLQSEEGPGEYSSSCRCAVSLCFPLGLESILHFPKWRMPHYPLHCSASSGGDPMVHWCHGAGGLVFLFCRAYEFFGDAVFLEAALRCGGCSAPSCGSPRCLLPSLPLFANIAFRGNTFPSRAADLAAGHPQKGTWAVSWCLRKWVCTPGDIQDPLSD